MGYKKNEFPINNYVLRTKLCFYAYASKIWSWQNTRQKPFKQASSLYQYIIEARGLSFAKADEKVDEVNNQYK